MNKSLLLIILVISFVLCGSLTALLLALTDSLAGPIVSGLTAFVCAFGAVATAFWIEGTGRDF